MKLEQCIEKFRRKIDKKSDNRFVYYKTAKKLIYKIRRKLKKDSSNIRLMSLCGSLALETNNIDLSFHMFKRAFQIDPNVESLNNLAYYYLYEHDDSEIAVELLEKAVKMNPKSEFPYALLGEAYTDLKIYDKSEENLKMAANFNPSFAILNNLGFTVYKQGRIEEAIIFFERALKDKENVETLLSYGISLAYVGRINEAEKVAEKLIYKLENFLKTEKLIYSDIWYLDIAAIYYETKNYKMACELFNEALKCGVGDYLSMFQYSLLQCGRSREAENLCQEFRLSKEKVIEDIRDSDFYSKKDEACFIEQNNDEIEQFLRLYVKIKNGYRPPLEFTPRYLRNCYLFGCIRHENELCSD